MVKWCNSGIIITGLYDHNNLGFDFNFYHQSVVNGDSTGVLKALMSLKETIVNLKTSFLRIYGR